MNFWQAIVMGLVQGLTEFLPVSSSGHIVLFQKILNIDLEGGDMFLGIMLHIGTLISLLAVYYKDVLGLFKKENGKKLLYLIIATVPAVIVGLIFEDFIERLFGGSFLAFGFLITAALLIVIERIAKRYPQEGEITLKTALTMGAFQAVAVIPGISRSGSTIAGGTFCGAKREKVADFSFLMSIPIIGGGALYQIIKFGSSGTLSGQNVFNIIVAMAVAAITGFFAIRFMLKIIKRSNYKWFSVYLLLLSVLTFVNEYVINFF